MTYEDSINEAVANNLVRFRHENSGWTQQRVADELGARLGRDVPVITIYRMEKGGRSFSAAEVFALAEVVGTTPQALCGQAEDSPEVRAEAKAVSDFLHRQIRLLQGTRQLVQQAGLDGTPVTEVPFRSLGEVLGDGAEA